MENVKVLIVDDEPNIRDLLSTSLRFAGFSVRAVANGADAVTAAEKGKPPLTAATLRAVTGSFGMTVSTSHSITTSIKGVGCAK